VAGKDRREAHILVVDGDEAMRDFICSLLERNEYRATTVASAEEARAALAREPADAVITEVELPGENGHALLDHVHREHRGVPVIVATGYPSSDTFLACMREGAMRFLVKPFAAQELTRAVSAALVEKERGREPDSLEVTRAFRNWVEITAPSRHEVLERLENFIDALYDTNLAREEKDDLKIAVSELATNAVEWGNQGDASRRIRISYCLFPEEIVFKIEDEGEGFDPEGVPAPNRDPLAHIMQRAAEGKRVGGYGMYIVRRIMDRVIYNEKGNAVILSKSLQQMRPAAPPTAGAHGARGEG